MLATVHRCLLFFLVFGLASEALAQPGRGPGGRDRGGFRAMQLLEPDSFLGASMSPPFPGSPSAAAMETLKLSEEQRTQLQSVREKMSEALRELPEDASDDDRKAKLISFEADALKVLNPEQRVTWDKGKAEYAQKVTEMRARFQEGGFGPRPIGGPPPTGSGPVPAGPQPPVGPRMALPNTPPPDGEQVAASFGATGGPAARPREPRMSFNFRYAPWAEVLKLFADAAGLTLDLNDSPAGTFNYYDDQEYTATEALDVLNGYLLPKGYILLRRDRFLVCVNIDEGIPPNLIPTITVEELGQRGKNELVSLVIPLNEGIEADKIVGEVRELLGPQGKASALKNTNSIVVADIGINVRRVYALLQAGTSVDNRETAFKSIPLKHISATDAERMVRRLFGLNPTTTSTTPTTQMQFSPWGGSPWGGGPPSFGRDGRPDFSQMQQQQQPSSSSRSSSSGTTSPYTGKIMVSADTRTNHLLVTASASLLKIVEEMVLAMDTDADASGKPIVASDSPIRLKVYNVTGADVAQVARTLSMLMPGLAIIDDARSAKLHIQATDPEHKEVEELLRSLTGDGANSVAVIPLTRLDPIAATNTLRNLFINEGTRAPTIEADALGRRLMVRGTPDQVAQVKALLTQLGEGGTTEQVESTNRGPVRTFPLGGRDPEEFLPLLRQVWATQTKNPIRVVVPSQPSPIQDRKIPSRNGNPLQGLFPETQPMPLQPAPVREPADDRSTRRPAAPTIQRASLQQPVEEVEPAEPQPPVRKLTNTLPDEDPLDRFLKSFLDDAEAKPAVTQPEAAMPAEGDDAPQTTATDGQQLPIGISIIGDEMVITSKDLEALDQFEALMETLSMSIPARTRWTVFYLRSADATETAQMLERLFPQSTVTTSTQSTDGLLGSFAGGMSSLGRGMMNVTGLNETLGGQSLRIVTDIRANALFVTGASDKIQEIEQMLQLLDSAELPESLRDRLPRSIAVEYADINEVADVIESVFKDSMQGEQGGGQQQQGRNFNPLQMLMAQGGGGQGGGRGARGPELTLGVDSRTSHLIVSCNDALFRRIEELVQTIDQRAKDARQTVRIVPLTTADPTLVSSTLSSLIPKVTVSATRSARRPRTQETGAQPGGGGVQDRPQPEAVRDPEVIRRMMESQMQQNRGGDTRNPFGGGVGSPFGGGAPTGGSSRGSSPFGGRSGRGN